MSSFYAELRIAGRVYPVRLCEWAFTQATDARGRVIARVRHGKVYITLDVPDDDFLFDWANTAYRPLPGCVVFFQTKGAAAQETLSWEEGHCVGYQEEFHHGSLTEGSYVCHLVIATPKLVMSPGGPPQPFVAPAPREHGSPAATNPVVAPPGIISDCTESVRQSLQNQVKQNCKSGKQSCLITDNCPVLEETMETLNSCIAARTKINMKCFKGGDKGHKKQVQDKINSLVTCQGYYFSKCNGVFQPVPVPRRMPSDEPSRLPELPGNAPVTVTGVGLFILYLLSSALRPGPI